MAAFNDRRSDGTLINVGPSYDPEAGREVDKLFEYNEGYQHGRRGAEYKGYGGRTKAIAYGAGYRHGKQDPLPKAAKRSKS